MEGTEEGSASVGTLEGSVDCGLGTSGSVGEEVEVEIFVEGVEGGVEVGLVKIG